MVLLPFKNRVWPKGKKEPLILFRGSFFYTRFFEFFNLVTHVTKFLQLITLSRKCAQLIELVCQ